MTTYSDARKRSPAAPASRPTDRDRRIWTPERDATLIALHRTGLSYAEIAWHMGISVNSAAARIAVLIRRGVLPAKRGKFVRRAPAPEPQR